MKDWKNNLKPKNLQALIKYLKYGRQNLTTYFSNATYKQNTIEKWTKAYIFSLPKKSDGIIKNYTGITYCYSC